MKTAEPVAVTIQGLAHPQNALVQKPAPEQTKSACKNGPCAKCASRDATSQTPAVEPQKATARCCS